MCSRTVTPCKISFSKYIIKSLEHKQSFNLAEKWVCAWAPFPTIYILNTDMIVWALGKVGLLSVQLWIHSAESLHKMILCWQRQMPQEAAL